MIIFLLTCIEIVYIIYKCAFNDSPTAGSSEHHIFRIPNCDFSIFYKTKIPIILTNYCLAYT